VGEGRIEVLAHAKINVFLRVLRLREDGYHDIESLVLPISLSDRLAFEPFHVIRTEGAGGGLAERNLATVAAEALARRCGSNGARIRLEKRIPIAAGLGGGSADAAATLLALNELWACGLSRPELMRLAAEAGSDVPALVHGGPVVMRGRGEMVERAEVAPMWWVVVPQDFAVPTPEAYGWWDEEPSTGPDPAALLAAARAGRLDELGGLLFNDLEGVVVARHPAIAEARRAALEAGALGVVMSGSGPTVAALSRDEGHARDIAAALSGSIPVCAPA
jgi:4-diphosphocytidyl-2-C-methyl-D-erythritol kinase